MAGLREFLLAGNPGAALPTLWSSGAGRDGTALDVNDVAEQGAAGLESGEGALAALPAAGTSLTLGDALRHNPALLQDDSAVKLLLLSLLEQLLDGRLHTCWPDSVAITSQLWPRPLHQPHPAAPAPPSAALDDQPSGMCSSDLKALTARWASGELSNFDYLLSLNRLAGRRPGDPSRCRIMPWVLDMTAEPDEAPTPGEGVPLPRGWRDLTRTKWRLAKGDEQLDLTYATSPVPHHLPGDALSDVAYCIYKARQLPQQVLTRVVRGRWNTQEYPASLERLYQVTPEEAIPEFYSDPSILISRHPSMPDLRLPDWASSPEEFIAKHRAALESDYVSSQLHHWIDLVFGYKLSGAAAVEAKNVQLAASQLPAAATGHSHSQQQHHLGTTGHVQLFFSPHPRRRLGCLEGAPTAAAAAEGPRASLAACLEQLEEFERDGVWAAAGCSLPGGRADAGSSGAAGCSGHHGPPSLLVQFGQLVVQLYMQRMVHLCPLDYRAWRALLPQLPPAARRLADACLAARVPLADVAALDFFTPAVRAAHAFLAPLWSCGPGGKAPAAGNSSSSSGGSISGGSSQQAGSTAAGLGPAEAAKLHSQLAYLIEVISEGRLLELVAVPGSLQLCLPSMLAVLREVLGLAEAVDAEAQGTPKAGGPSYSASGTPAARRAAGVLLSLLGKAQHALCCQHLLPAAASWLGSRVGGGGAAELPRASRLALLSPQLISGMLAGGGVAAYMELVQPVLLRQLLIRGGSSGGDMVGAIGAALGSVAGQIPPPITFELTVRPLLHALPGCPAAALALMEVGAALPPHLAASYVLRQLLQVFEPGREWDYAPAPSAILNTLAALEGLAPLLPAALALRSLVLPPQQPPTGMLVAEDAAPAPLMAALLRPEQQGPWWANPATAHAVLTRIAALLVQVCSSCGPDAVMQDLLPQLVPLFTCAEGHRLKYGMDMPGSSPSRQRPLESASPGGAPTPARPAAGNATAAAADPGAAVAAPDELRGTPGLVPWAGGGGSWEEEDGGATCASGSDSGYWDVVSVLYPPCLEAVGAQALHSLVPSWEVIELNLQVRYEWRPPATALGSSPVLRQLLPLVQEQAAWFCSNPRFSAGPAPPAELQEALRRVEATSRLIDGVAWLSPSSPTPEEARKAPLVAAGGSVPSPPPRALPAHPAGAGPAGASAAGGRPAAWVWHAPLDADWLAGLAGAGGGPGALNYQMQSSWQLAAVALHEFRAHKERLRLCLADEERQVVITAGKGRECEVIRTWALGDGEPGAQYVQHDTAIVSSLCLVGGGAAAAAPHVASVDASGALHLWSLASGEQALCLREAPGSTKAPLPAGQLRFRGWLLAAPAAGSGSAPPPPGLASLPSRSSFDAHHDPAGADAPEDPPSPEPPVAPGAQGAAGFTHVARMGSGGGQGEGGWEPGLVAAGTGSGCVCLLDLDRGELAGHLGCAPGTQGLPACVAVSALCCARSWVAAGTRGGWVSVLDPRSGEVVWWFRRHEAEVSALGAYRGHYLVSAAKEGSVKLWDLRMGGSQRGPSPQPATSNASQQWHGDAATVATCDDAPLLPSLATGASIPLCLGTFKMGGGDAASASAAAAGGGVGGLAMYGQQACICYAGDRLGVINLTPGGAGSKSRVSVTRLLGAGGAPVAGGAPIRGLSILPLSRLFVVGTEDGWVRVCR